MSINCKKNYTANKNILYICYTKVNILNNASSVNVRKKKFKSRRNKISPNSLRKLKVKKHWDLNFTEI